MRNSIRKNLALRTGALIALGALLFSVLLSYFFFNQTYHEELITADKRLQQLVATVESSAAIAAYLDNPELAAEVTRGLVKNDVVAGLVLMSETGMREMSGEALLESELASSNETALHRFPLASPFEPTERVGQIVVKTNRAFIESTARHAAAVHVLTMLAHSLAVAGLVIVLVYRQLTRPLKSLADKLHVIEPGSDKRLQRPRGHEDDEIGQLVDDTNHLLESVQTNLDRERGLRIEVESLGRRFRLIFENASGGIALSDQEGQLQLFNSAFKHIVGEQRIKRLTSQEVNLPDLFEDTAAVHDALQGAPHSKTPIALDLKLFSYETHPACWLHSLFSSVHDEAGGLLIEWIVYDVSERAKREQQALFEAERDPLTHLFSRRAGKRRIMDALDKARAAGRHCALCLIDLDCFKSINDLYGHEAGDNVLIEVAQRLSDCLRSEDVIIRWGGDELVVLVTQGHGGFDIIAVAERLLSSFGKAINLGKGHYKRIGASIGVALFPEHGETLSDLLDRADSVMYRAKKEGGYGFVVYDDS
jgi:diguanylate cyclase (GGDEF)-like protein/PAS domain S-box-containing protein